MHTHTKKGLKWIIGLDRKAKITNFLKKKQNFVKFKHVCSSKDTLKKRTGKQQTIRFTIHMVR